MLFSKYQFVGVEYIGYRPLDLIQMKNTLYAMTLYQKKNTCLDGLNIMTKQYICRAGLVHFMNTNECGYCVLILRSHLM